MEPSERPRAIVRTLEGAQRIVLEVALLVATASAVWQVVGLKLLDQPIRDTATVQLTAEELAALKRMLKPQPMTSGGGTQLAITQVRGLAEKLNEIDKVLMPVGLSPSAGGDLRLVQRDVEHLREKQVFHAQLVKDQMVEVASQTRWVLGTMLTLNLAIIGFFWQLSKKVKAKDE